MPKFSLARSNPKKLLDICQEEIGFAEAPAQASEEEKQIKNLQTYPLSLSFYPELESFQPHFF